MVSPRTVCLAVDDSPVGRDTVSWAAKAVLRPDEEVHVVSVLEPAVRSEFVTAGEGGPTARLESECKPDPLQLERTTAMLKEAKEELQRQGINNVHLTTLVSCVGGSHDLGRHIVEHAQGQHADMLICGSRGLGAARRTMLSLFGLGSVSEYVIRRAPMDVLVHKVQAGKVPLAKAD